MELHEAFAIMTNFKPLLPQGSGSWSLHFRRSTGMRGSADSFSYQFSNSVAQVATCAQPTLHRLARLRRKDRWDAGHAPKRDVSRHSKLAKQPNQASLADASKRWKALSPQGCYRSNSPAFKVGLQQEKPGQNSDSSAAGRSSNRCFASPP